MAFMETTTTPKGGSHHPKRDGDAEQSSTKKLLPDTNEFISFSSFLSRDYSMYN